MNETIITIIFLSAVILIIEVISIVTRLLIDSGEDVPVLNPALLIESGENPQKKLDAVYRYIRLNGDRHMGTVIIVCEKEDEAVYNVCRKFCDENTGFILCQGDDLKNILFQLQKKEESNCNS